MINQHCGSKVRPSISSREEYLRDLQRSIEKANDTIEQFTNQIGWSGPCKMQTFQQDGVVQGTQMTRSCRETVKNQEENPYSEEPCLPSIPSKSQFVVTIDADKQREILQPFQTQAGWDTRQPPNTAGELTANFTKEERLALYEYTLKNAAAVAKPPELLSPEEVLLGQGQASSKEELTPLELKKAMRDFKRRRQAYRTKVSTKNKSQTQVTREIIHNMMVFLGAEEQEQEIQDPQITTDVSNVHNASSSSRDLTKSERDDDVPSNKRNNRQYFEGSEDRYKDKKSRCDAEEHGFKRYGKDKYRPYRNERLERDQNYERTENGAGGSKVREKRKFDGVYEVQLKKKNEEDEYTEKEKMTYESTSSEESSRHRKKRKLKKSKHKKSSKVKKSRRSKKSDSE